jgi:preprotein translocase subunit SecD
MNRNLLWRGILILAVTLIAFALAYPLNEKINLGLDLQGGMHLVLQVKTEDALRAEVENEAQRLVRVAGEEKITGLSARRVGDTRFELAGVNEASRDRVTSLASRYLPDFTLAKGATGLVYEMTPQAANRVRELSVRQALETIRNRIDQFGVAEPVIQEASGYRVVVQLPGVDDPERVRRLIKSTAFLEFRLVHGQQAGLPTREAVVAGLGGQVPADVEIMEGDVHDRNNRAQVVGKQYYAVEKRRVITGRDL